VHVIFQPHRFTRTRDLMDEFATAFADADTVCLLDIYAANEKPIEGVTAESLASRITASGKTDVIYSPTSAEAIASVASVAKPGDMVLTLGAGNVSQLGSTLLEKLSAS
jgi:UDP-N-acetylmuramate--alanine ligase